MTIHSSINHLADQNRSGCILCTNTTPLRVLDYPEFSVCCPVPEAVGLLTLPSRWLLANLPPSLSRTHSLTQTHARAHTHTTTHTLIYACTHITHFQLQAAKTLVNDSAAIVLHFITPGTLSLMHF